MTRRRYRFNNLINAYDDPRTPAQRLAAALGIPLEELGEVEVLRRSLDARQKPRLKDVIAFSFLADPSRLPKGDSRIEEWSPPEFPELPRITIRQRPIIVGAGPAGQFAALGLAARGYQPILLERGGNLSQRRRDVKDLWLRRSLNPDSNVQFGEGGAGTFSDGKLTSRGSSWFTRQVLDWFVTMGASSGILSSHLPHIGTEGIRKVSLNLRRLLEEAGAEFHFNSRVTEILNHGDTATLVTANGDQFTSDAVLLAIGHSARDTVEMLNGIGVAMELKPFAMGLRIEHPRGLIDEQQYGRGCRLDITGAATYKLAAKADKKGRGIYSFCMCPGGMVVLAASEEGCLVVNGMSWVSRRMAWSNSALVLQVGPDDLHRWAAEWGLPGDVLVGHRVQRRIEELAFQQGGADWNAPAQRAADFMRRKPSRGELPKSSYRPSLRPTRLDGLLPEPLAEGMRAGLARFDRSMKGFIGEGLLIAPETRTSAPLRLMRDPGQRNSLSHAWLYPLGEGAGYSGGIVSSAADGLRTALGFSPRATPMLEAGPPETWG